MKPIAQFMNCEKQTAYRDAARTINEPRCTRGPGKTMRCIPIPILVLLAVVCAFPTYAAEISPIKCGANEDRVWVYDSLNSFDVALKLKCGELVEIISREKGYVKIRTSSGKEGYVPEKALPKPPEPEGNNQNSSEAQTSSQQEPQSVVAAARARTSASTQQTAKPQPISTRSQANTAVQPPVRSAPQPTGVANTDSQTASAGQTKTQSASNTAAANTKRSAVKAGSSKDVSVPNTPAVAPAPVAATASNIELADNLPSASPALSASTHVTAPPRDADEEEDPVVKPLENNEACKIYFSAYGLSPNQYKWMSRNRGKAFAGICPAPAPALVDFVVIFTHDADFYNGTMPTLVHTDKNGFSDFTPLTAVDSAVVSPSDADKNRHEYVWVFHTKRGTFDPAKFSPKRRPLFSSTESNKLGTAAGSRSAEDALRFMQQHGIDR
jgi:hypothetical protein